MLIPIRVKTMKYFLLVILLVILAQMSEYEITSQQAREIIAQEIASGDTVDCKIVNGEVWCRDTSKEIKDLYKELRK